MSILKCYPTKHPKTQWLKNIIVKAPWVGCEGWQLYWLDTALAALLDAGLQVWVRPTSFILLEPAGWLGRVLLMLIMGAQQSKSSYREYFKFWPVSQDLDFEDDSDWDMDRACGIRFAVQLGAEARFGATWFWWDRGKVYGSSTPLGHVTSALEIYHLLIVSIYLLSD